MTHELKCWPDQFQALIDERKGFEFRRNDRDFNVDDTLFLREYDPDTDTFSGRTCRRRVTYILREGFGLPGGTVVMSVKPIPEVEPRERG
jgi:hypothetical protein